MYDVSLITQFDVFRNTSMSRTRFKYVYEHDFTCSNKINCKLHVIIKYTINHRPTYDISETMSKHAVAMRVGRIILLLPVKCFEYERNAEKKASSGFVRNHLTFVALIFQTLQCFFVPANRTRCGGNVCALESPVIFSITYPFFTVVGNRSGVLKDFSPIRRQSRKRRFQKIIVFLMLFCSAFSTSIISYVEKQMYGFMLPCRFLCRRFQQRWKKNGNDFTSNL